MANLTPFEPEASRPSLTMVLLAVVGLLVGMVMYHWSDISANAQVQQIERFLGIDLK